MKSPTEFNKKGWLDYLYYKVGGQQFDFYLSGTFIVNGEKQFRKWKKYSEVIMPIGNEDYKIEWINQRQILPNEIVLDIEDPKQLPKIIENIKKWEWDYKTFKTGSRGYHIHLFSKDVFTPEEKEVIILKLGTDVQKCSEKNLIALENCPHWKTGNLKLEVKL